MPKVLQYATVGSVARPREQSCAWVGAARYRRSSTGRAAEELPGAPPAAARWHWAWMCGMAVQISLTLDKNTKHKEQEKTAA